MPAATHLSLPDRGPYRQNYLLIPIHDSSVPPNTIDRRARDAQDRPPHRESERSILPMPPFEQFGIPFFVARIVYSAAKCIENTLVYASPLMFAQLSIHSLSILISKFRRFTKSNLPEMPSQIRPNPGDFLQQILGIILSWHFFSRHC